jgi:hypothetical protein
MNKLRSGSVLAMVVPNRLFRNRNASGVRQMLVNEAHLRTVVDFGTTEVLLTRTD